MMKAKYENEYLKEVKVMFNDRDISKYVEAPLDIIDDDGEMIKLMPNLNWVDGD